MVSRKGNNLLKCRYRIFLCTAFLLVFITGFTLGEAPSQPNLVGIETSTSGSPSGGKNPLQVVFFHSPTCEECHKVERFLPGEERRWGSQIRIETKNIENMEVFNELFLYEKHYGVQVNAPPVIFVGGRYLAGAKDIISRLDEVIAQELAAGSVTFAPSTPAGEEPSTSKEAVPFEILSRFESFSVGAIIIAGLLDGINPCAFTTIIFLLSVLTVLGKSKRELALVGIGFTVAVFVTYFLLGLGLLGAIKSFSVSRGISVAITYVVAVLVLALAGWSFVDFIRYTRSGDVKKVTLGLPKSVKAKIHKVIRAGLTTRSLLIGSISVGFLVALLESLCTGQVYLPTIVFVARAPGLRSDAIGYLLLYNLMFIIPLVVILVIAYFGVKSERLGDFLRCHLAAFKLVMAVLFAGLGVLLLTTV